MKAPINCPIKNGIENPYEDVFIMLLIHKCTAITVTIQLIILNIFLFIADSF
jgi:hypothetical protein